MNKKEVNELKKRFTSERSTISTLCGCYVNGEKEKIMEFSESFQLYEEEERHKYFDIFRKAMSGQFGRNLFDLEFPLEAEEEGGTQHRLMQVRASKLKDEALLSGFYDEIIANFSYDGNYLILILHDSYDVPGKTTDGITMDDASEEVFQYVLCCICPVNLAKPALRYDQEQKKFLRREQDWLLESPEVAFLFPAFNDRSTDIHSTLYYAKDVDNLHDEFIDSMLAGVAPVPANSQKEIFKAIVTETLGSECGYEEIRNIQETICEKIEATKEIPEPLTLTKNDVKNVLLDSGIEKERLENFDVVYEAVLPKETPLLAANVIDTKKVELKAPGVTIRVKPEAAHLLSTMTIGGRSCIVIPMDDEVEVNGIPVSAGLLPQEEELPIE